MIMKIKRYSYYLFNIVSKGIFNIFYKKNYLKGKYFRYEKYKYIGWKWCWKCFFFQKILRINGNIPWPVSPFNEISNYENIIFNINDINNFQGKGKYFQNFSAKIIIGNGSYIANNVGIITANHNVYDLERHEDGLDVIIGDKCWIGMNSVILPGVKLGDNTVVGAGSIVTKSFESGNCVIAGSPARIIKKL